MWGKTYLFEQKPFVNVGSISIHFTVLLVGKSLYDLTISTWKVWNWFICHCHFHISSLFYPQLHSTFIFKRNEWLVSAEKIKIEYFFKKIFSFHAYVSVDNDTINNSDKNLVCKYIYQSSLVRMFCSWRWLHISDILNKTHFYGVIKLCVSTVPGNVFSSFLFQLYRSTFHHFHTPVKAYLMQGGLLSAMPPSSLKS